MNSRLYFSTLLLAIALCGCSSGPGRQAAESAPPARIVTINGTATETVAALGLLDRIVGVDVTSTYPASVSALPKVGHDRNVKAEGVISLEPDMVIAGTWQMDATVLGQLRSSGERVLQIPLELTVQGTKAMIQRLADSLHVPERAAALIATIDDDMQGLRPLAQAPKVLFIYARGAGALMVAGTGTPMHSMIELAGGRNAMTEFEQFKPLTPEALIAADPDAVLMFSSGMDALQGVEGLLKVPGMSATKAGRTKAFIAMDGGLLSNFGPRLGSAIAELNAHFNALPQLP